MLAVPASDGLVLHVEIDDPVAVEALSRRRRRRRRLGVVGGIVAVAAVLAGLFFLFSPGNNQVAVPDVTNQPQDVALRTLTGAGLKPNLVPVASTATQVGTEGP